MLNVSNSTLEQTAAVNKHTTTVFIIPILTIISFVCRALGKGMPNYWNQTVHCLRAKEAGLSQAQVQMCRQNLDLMRVVSHAALLANSTCQRIFADRRWNCSSVTRVPHLTPDLTSGRWRHL